MLAVLVLAAITAVTFSLVTIVFIELRSSTDVLRTEPALYATLGVTEEALFQYKRFVNEREDGTVVPTLNVESCLPFKKYICELGGVTLTLPGTQPLSFDNSPAVIPVYGGEIVKIPLYALNDFEIIYDKIDIRLIPNGVTSTLNVYLDLTPMDNSNPPDIVVDSTFGVNDSANLVNLMTPGYQYDLVLDNRGSSQTFVMNVVSTASSDAPPPYSKGDSMGLPFVGKKALRVVADYLGLTRTYTVRIPVP